MHSYCHIIIPSYQQLWVLRFWYLYVTTNSNTLSGNFSNKEFMIETLGTVMNYLDSSRPSIYRPKMILVHKLVTQSPSQTSHQLESYAAMSSDSSQWHQSPNSDISIFYPSEVKLWSPSFMWKQEKSDLSRERKKNHILNLTLFTI